MFLNQLLTVMVTADQPLVFPIEHGMLAWEYFEKVLI